MVLFRSLFGGIIHFIQFFNAWTFCSLWIPPFVGMKDKLEEFTSLEMKLMHHSIMANIICDLCMLVLQFSYMCHNICLHCLVNFNNFLICESFLVSTLRFSRLLDMSTK
jgi:hypothetical protein